MIKHIIPLVALVILVSSCEINQRDVQPTDNIIKIYNHPDENLAFYVESIIKLEEGYLILSGVKDLTNPDNFLTSSLIKTNTLGEIEWTSENDFLGPAGNLVEFDGKIGYVAKDASNKALFIEVNTANGDVSPEPLITGDWPLASDVTEDNKLVLLTYNINTFNTAITTFNSLASISDSAQFGVGTDMRLPIQNHLNKTGDIFPFYIGDWSSDSDKGFFVNCLANYTIGVLFFNADGSLENNGTGVFNHTWAHAGGTSNGISSLIHKTGRQFGLSRYYGNGNFMHPTVTIEKFEQKNFNDSVSTPIQEVIPKAKVSAIKATFGANEYMLFGTTSYSNSLVLFQYKMDDDELLYKHEISFTDNFEVVQIIQDPADEGIVVLAQMHVTGKFQRPVMVKIPSKDFSQE